MSNRRQFLRIGVGFLAGIGVLFSPFFSAVRWVYAKTQRIILPRGTEEESLILKNPKSLDASNLDTTPLKNFGTMGQTDYEVNLEEWRLEVTGKVKAALNLTYPEILALPSVEKKVLLICPGFFANHGQWKGISMLALLEKALMEKDVTHVTFAGPKGSDEKVEKFPIEDVLSNKVFLAYGVNGEVLPKENGFPLRVVAEDYYGDDWVKYVYKVNLEKT
jgi:sulfoxide reductase catalytic subunit YedY